MCSAPISRALWQRRQGFNPVCSEGCRKSWLIQNRFGGYAIQFNRLKRWSANFAYFLGLMVTDGNVMDNGCVSFVSLDQCLTEFVRDFVSPDSPIREETTRAGATVYRWSIWSRELAEILARRGIHPRKSRTVCIPAIPDHYVYDWLRGVLDGDGSVDKIGRASVATGSPSFALGLSALLGGLGLESNIYEKRTCFSVALNAASSRILGSRIYRDGAPCLDRKRLRFRPLRSDDLG